MMQLLKFAKNVVAQAHTTLKCKTDEWMIQIMLIKEKKNVSCIEYQSQNDPNDGLLYYLVMQRWHC